MSLVEFKLRPTGPWRVGHPTGDRERVDTIYHSDALYSAVTQAMKALGWMEDWLGATARAGGETKVRFTSLFPFAGKTRLVTPPKGTWPTRLVPLEIAQGATLDPERWTVDGQSQCLIPSGGQAPFQTSIRNAAAVDRLTGATEPHRTACLEFALNAGWWGLYQADEGWDARVKSALRLLADSGFGAERSRGWGRSREPEFSPFDLQNKPNGAWWLLSLYSPAETDTVDWTKGDYSATTRGGWTDSTAASGPKKQVRMIDEGSVLWANALNGRAVDVAPDGFPHPVYRSGIGFALPAPGHAEVAA